MLLLPKPLTQNSRPVVAPADTPEPATPLARIDESPRADAIRVFTRFNAWPTVPIPAPVFAEPVVGASFGSSVWSCATL